jgi:hypothetical protein
MVSETLIACLDINPISFRDLIDLLFIIAKDVTHTKSQQASLPSLVPIFHLQFSMVRRGTLIYSTLPTLGCS